MRIGRLEFRWHKKPEALPPSNEPNDLSYALAVPANEIWYRAIHQAIDILERESVQAARNHTANPNLCIAYTGNGEGIAMFRERLRELRERAIEFQQRLKRTRVL